MFGNTCRSYLVTCAWGVVLVAAFGATAVAGSENCEVYGGGKPSPNVFETEWFLRRARHPRALVVEVRYGRLRKVHPFEHTYGVLEIYDYDVHTWRHLGNMSSNSSSVGKIIRANVDRYIRSGRIKVRCRSGHRTDFGWKETAVSVRAAY